MCQGNLALVGSNQANVMDDSVQFTFCFAMDAGATWLGWQFVMDGSKYYKQSTVPSGYGDSRWVANFIGGDADLAIPVYGTGHWRRRAGSQRRPGLPGVRSGSRTGNACAAWPWPRRCGASSAAAKHVCPINPTEPLWFRLDRVMATASDAGDTEKRDLGLAEGEITAGAG